MKKILLGVLGVMVLGGIVFIAINWRDEAPSPLSIALASLPENNVPDEQNAFYAMAGLRVQTGQDMTAEGRKMIALYRQYINIKATQRTALTAQEEAVITELKQSYGKVSALSVKEGGKDFVSLGCGKPFIDCLQKPLSREELKTLQYQLSANAELLRRYRQIIAMDGYYDPLPGFKSELPTYG